MRNSFIFVMKFRYDVNQNTTEDLGSAGREDLRIEQEFFDKFEEDLNAFPSCFLTEFQ